MVKEEAVVDAVPCNIMPTGPEDDFLGMHGRQQVKDFICRRRNVKKLWKRRVQSWSPIANWGLENIYLSKVKIKCITF